MTVGQSPAYDFFSVSDEQKAVFLVSVLSAIHMEVTDRPSPDAPSLTQAIIVQMVYWVAIRVNSDICTQARSIRMFFLPLLLERPIPYSFLSFLALIFEPCTWLEKKSHRSFCMVCLAAID